MNFLCVKYGLIFSGLIVFGCEARFDFRTDRVNSTRIIVDGFIHQGNNPYVVRISQLATAGAPTPIAQAKVKIYNQDSVSVELKEEKTGLYATLGDDKFGFSDGLYFLSIELSSGTKYRSSWEEMPSQEVNNALGWREYQRSLTSESGTDFEIPVVGISLSATLDKESNNEPLISFMVRGGGLSVYPY